MQKSTHRIHVYGILTYIWLICMVNVGKYTIHGSYGFGMTRMFCGPRMNMNKELSEPIVFKELSLTLAVSLGVFQLYL